MPTRVQVRRGTTAQWNTSNPVLAPGEIGYNTDVKQMKIGDGTSNWSALSYINSYRGIQTLTPTTGTVTINMSDGNIVQHDISGAVTYVLSNIRPGASITVVINCDESDRNLTFPESWKFFGARPTRILQDTSAVLTLNSLGSDNSGILATWTSQAGSNRVAYGVQIAEKRITSTSDTDTGLSATITPSSTASKILVQVVQPFSVTLRNNDEAGITLRLFRGSTSIQSTQFRIESDYNEAVPDIHQFSSTANFLNVDVPASSAPVTYKTVYARNTGSADSATFFAGAHIVLTEIDV